jgi:hypothetical protein
VSSDTPYVAREDWHDRRMSQLTDGTPPSSAEQGSRLTKLSHVAVMASIAVVFTAALMAIFGALTRSLAVQQLS